MNDADSLKPDAESEVAALLCRLQVTQRRLEELTGGTLDKVKATEREAAEMQMAILNALPAQIALIDGSGVILSVNDAWRRFASANAILNSDFFVGQNYLEVCERAVGDCSSEAREAAVGIRRVLQGEIKEFSLEYPCHSPTEPLWFRLMVTPLREDSRLGAVVMHVNVTEQRVAEEALRGSEQRLNFALEAAKIGDWNLNFTTNDIHRSLRHDQCFGYTEAVDDWSQDTFLNHVNELDRERVAASFEKAKSGKGNYDEEFRTTWPDGSSASTSGSKSTLRMWFGPATTCE